MVARICPICDARRWGLDCMYAKIPLSLQCDVSSLVREFRLKSATQKSMLAQRHVILDAWVQIFCVSILMYVSLYSITRSWRAEQIEHVSVEALDLRQQLLWMNEVTGRLLSRAATPAGAESARFVTT